MLTSMKTKLWRELFHTTKYSTMSGSHETDAYLYFMQMFILFLQGWSIGDIINIFTVFIFDKFKKDLSKVILFGKI